MLFSFHRGRGLQKVRAADDAAAVFAVKGKYAHEVFLAAARVCPQDIQAVHAGVHDQPEAAQRSLVQPGRMRLFSASPAQEPALSERERADLVLTPAAHAALGHRGDPCQRAHAADADTRRSIEILGPLHVIQGLLQQKEAERIILRRRHDLTEHQHHGRAQQGAADGGVAILDRGLTQRKQAACAAAVQLIDPACPAAARACGCGCSRQRLARMPAHACPKASAA